MVYHQLFKSLKVAKPLTSREHIEYSFGRKNWDVDEQYEQIWLILISGHKQNAYALSSNNIQHDIRILKSPNLSKTIHHVFVAALIQNCFSADIGD